MKKQDEKMKQVLLRLALQKRDPMGEAWIENKELQSITKMEPFELNDAIELASSMMLVDVRNSMGTAPYKFHSITINAKGRHWLES